MARNHVQPGKVIPFTAGANVASGDLVLIGSLVGIALGAVANGATGEAQIEEVFEVPKLSTDVMGAGVLVYLDAANKRVTLSDGSGANKPAGTTIAAAGNGVETVKLKLNFGVAYIEVEGA